MTIKHVNANTYEFREGRKLFGVAEVSDDGGNFSAGGHEDLSLWLAQIDTGDLAEQLSKARKYGSIRV